jgi:hypothetical protein
MEMLILYKTIFLTFIFIYYKSASYKKNREALGYIIR